MEGEAVGLYVHVPFCRRKCTYCDFVSLAGRQELWPAYRDALVREIEAMPPLRPRTLYVGGGTPTIWPAPYLGELTRAARRAGLAADAEVSVEANPGTVDPEKLAELRRAGYNRLSIGVQSTVEANLWLLGRIHAHADSEAAVAWARLAGFTNVSIDMIYGLPGQSLAEWCADLRRALALGSDHLSAYGLSLEGGTPLAAAVAGGALPEPDPDAAADMYEATEDILAAAGYHQYEISNWARAASQALAPAAEGGRGAEGNRRNLLTCRHNLIYWRNEPYLGLGAGAHSFLGGRRCARVADPVAYTTATYAAKIAFCEAIDAPLEMAETAILGLRLTSGLDRRRFLDRFGVDPLSLYADVFAEAQRQGLLVVQQEAVRLTRRGRLLSNEVFQRLLPG